VSVKEQAAIFLYMCVTGLSVWHVGERFQRSNETVSRQVLFPFVQEILINLIYCQIFPSNP
ncbi:hypothetical protein FA15DRAFT_606434, partial [Coprinopsis marcescibilis]